jgi:hypothetical protein
MSERSRSIARWLAAGASLAAGAYAAYAAVAWSRYGHPSPPGPDEADALLDGFMPDYEVADRHHIRVAAPANVTLAAAREMDLLHMPAVRAIVTARELILGAERDTSTRPRGLLAETLSIGWGLLAEVPDREVVVGAVTRPWEPNVTFRPIPPDEFAAFAEPGYVKIVWTLRADPVDAYRSIFRTETRVIATDAVARTKFRRYWSFLSPGIILIRRLSLRPLKADAERRAAAPVPATARR